MRLWQEQVFDRLTYLILYEWFIVSALILMLTRGPVNVHPRAPHVIELL